MTSTETSGFNPLAFLSRFYASSIGKKLIMAVTGVIMWGFVIGHMVGNLQIFIPADGAIALDGYWGESINVYAQFLKETPALLWGTRITLIVAVLLHVVTGVQLAASNRSARPARYQGAAESRAATLWSRTMAFSGLVVGLFILFHLAHFTFGALDPSTFAENNLRDGIPDVYNMVRDAFRNPVVVGIYVVGTLLLVAHLVHGTQSVWQTIGLNHPSWTPLVRIVSWLTVAAILAGNLSVPLVLYYFHTTGH